MAEHAGKPKVRFAGFTETWEQRKLGEIADKVTEKNTTLRYTEALTNSAEFGIIGQRDFFDHDVAKLSSLHGYYIVKEDDFVYNPRISVTAPVGPVNRNKLGKIGVVSPLYTVLRTAQIDNEFLEWFFKSACWHSFMIFNGDSGARSDRFSIKNSTFFEMPIPCPCRMEQVRIGTFFRHLDRLITLHQRKRGRLENIKKAMLEKMFPKNGADVPEVRFAGFTEAWEQRKLGDLAEFNPKAELPTNFEYVDLESVVGTELINHRTQTKCTAPSRAQRLAQYGDLFYQLVRPYQKNNYLFELNSENFVFSTGYAQLRPSVDGYFLMSLVQNEYFVQKVLDNCTGTSYPAINVNDLAEINIYTSLKKSEQARIGTFFRQLDRLVTLHQRKHILLT